MIFMLSYSLLSYNRILENSWIVFTLFMCMLSDSMLKCLKELRANSQDLIWIENSHLWAFKARSCGS